MEVLKLLLPAIALAITAGCSDSGRIIVASNDADDENIATDTLLEDALPVGLSSTAEQDFAGELIGVKIEVLAVFIPI